MPVFSFKTEFSFFFASANLHSFRPILNQKITKLLMLPCSWPLSSFFSLTDWNLWFKQSLVLVLTNNVDVEWKGKKYLFRFPRSGDRIFQREGAVLRTGIYCICRGTPYMNICCMFHPRVY